MYLSTYGYVHCHGKWTDFHSPDGTDSTTVDYGLGHLERFLEFILRPSSNGLLYEQCSLREVLQDLELDIPARTSGAAELGRRADDKGAGTFTSRRVIDKVIEGLEDASVFICGTHEGLAFFGENCGCTVDCRIDECDHLETRAELTEEPGGVRVCKAG